MTRRTGKIRCQSAKSGGGLQLPLQDRMASVGVKGSLFCKADTGISCAPRFFYAPPNILIVSAQFCADSSAPQISAILLGHFTWDNYSLRESP